MRQKYSFYPTRYYQSADNRVSHASKNKIIANYPGFMFILYQLVVTA